MKILVLHGPNLNLLGTREPEVYGSLTLDDINNRLMDLGRELDTEVKCVQSNHEGALIDALHEARTWANGVVFNPGAYTHTSIALRDAISAVGISTIEVHLSNIFAREPERRRSVLADLAVGVVDGDVAVGGADAQVAGHLADPGAAVVVLHLCVALDGGDAHIAAGNDDQTTGSATQRQRTGRGVEAGRAGVVDPDLTHGLDADLTESAVGADVALTIRALSRGFRAATQLWHRSCSSASTAACGVSCRWQTCCASSGWWCWDRRSASSPFSCSTASTACLDPSSSSIPPSSAPAWSDRGCCSGC